MKITVTKNHRYGRHRISRPLQIESPKSLAANSLPKICFAKNIGKHYFLGGNNLKALKILVYTNFFDNIFLAKFFF